MFALGLRGYLSRPSNTFDGLLTLGLLVRGPWGARLAFTGCCPGRSHPNTILCPRAFGQPCRTHIWLYVCPRLSTFHLSDRVSVHTPVSLSASLICPPICLSIHLSTHLSMYCPCMSPHICPCVCPCISSCVCLCMPPDFAHSASLTRRLCRRV